MKSYDKYVQECDFGTIASPSCNIVIDSTGLYCLCGCEEDVIIWNIKKNEIIKRWKCQEDGCKVTFIARVNGSTYGVGYHNGDVRIFSLVENEQIVRFQGHSRKITYLACDSTGSYLASGSSDGKIAVWDLIQETGIMQFKEHKDVITGLMFMKGLDIEGTIYEQKDIPVLLYGLYIISTSKDSFMKVWDLNTKQCIQIVTEHRLAINCFSVFDSDISNRDKYIVTGSNSEKLKVFSLNLSMRENDSPVTFLTDLDRTVKEPLKNITVLSTHFGNARLMFLQSFSNRIEVFKILNDKEIENIRKKRKKRKLKSLIDKNEIDNVEIDLNDDLFKMLPSIVLENNAFSISSVYLQGKRSLIAVGLFSNKIECYGLKSSFVNRSQVSNTAVTNSSDKLGFSILRIDKKGHRRPIRFVSMSRNGKLAMSLSDDSIHIWDPTEGDLVLIINLLDKICYRNGKEREFLMFGSESGKFTPVVGIFDYNEENIIVGSKEGTILVFDIVSGDCIHNTIANRLFTNKIWSMCLYKEDTFIAGGSDKEVKFIKYKRDGEAFSLTVDRSLRTDDEVVCIKAIFNGKYLGISLISSTINIHYIDTLRFYISLYGHKLPAFSIDFSHDERVCVSGSYDKNIKIWGLDFGDCKKSIFDNYNDTGSEITGVSFIPLTNNFVSVEKSGIVKYWDSSSLKKIVNLGYHHSEAVGICVPSDNRNIFVTATERNIKTWCLVQEYDPIFLEEESEKERTKQFETSLVTEMNARSSARGGTDSMVSLYTIKSSKDAGKLFELVDLVFKDFEERKKVGYKKCGELMVISSGDEKELSEYSMLRLVESIDSSDIPQIVLLLPSDTITKLIKLIRIWLEYRWSILLCINLMNHILKIHPNLYQSKTLLFNDLYADLLEIRNLGKTQIKLLRDDMSLNIHSLKVLKNKFNPEHNDVFIETK